MEIKVSKERIKELVEEKRVLHNNFLSCSDRGIQPDFEVEYEAVNGMKIIAGALTDFKYLDEPDKVWIIYPEYIDELGCTITRRDALVASKGKARIYIPNRENIETHKQIASLGAQGLMMFGGTILANITITKMYF